MECLWPQEVDERSSVMGARPRTGLQMDWDEFGWVRDEETVITIALLKMFEGQSRKSVSVSEDRRTHCFASLLLCNRALNLGAYKRPRIVGGDSNIWLQSA